MQELNFEFTLVKSNASLALPRKLKSLFVRFCLGKSLQNEAFDGVSQQILVDYVAVAIFGEIEEDFGAEAIFDFVVENLVKKFKSSDT